VTAEPRLSTLELPRYEHCTLDGLRMSRDQLARVMRAVIRCGAQVIGAAEVDGEYRRAALNEARLELWIPTGKRPAFEEIAGRRVTGTRKRKA
jgi:hypothetical protein